MNVTSVVKRSERRVDWSPFIRNAADLIAESEIRNAADLIPAY